MWGRRKILSFASFALVLAGVVLLLVVPLPVRWRSGWCSKLLDLGHIPLFAVLTLAIHRLLRTRLDVACGCAIAAAGACEVLQSLVHRSADFGDFVRGAIGSFLVAVLLRMSDSIRDIGRVLAYSALSIALLSWPIADAAPKLWDALVAYRSFPIISDFSTRWSPERWTTDQLAVHRVTAAWWPGEWVGRIDCFPSDQHRAAAILFPVRGDWSGYRRFCCDFFLPDGPAEILISIRDGRKVTGPKKRFDLESVYQSGDQQVRLDLDWLARGVEFAPLDLSSIQSFHIVVQHVEQPQSLYLRRIWLE